MGITEDAIDTAFDILSGGEAVCLLGGSGCGKSLCAAPGGILHTRLIGNGIKQRLQTNGSPLVWAGTIL